MNNFLRTLLDLLSSFLGGNKAQAATLSSGGITLRNPDLAWDGKTKYIQDRPIEAPRDWQLFVEQIENNPSPYILHKDYGFEINANHVRSSIFFSQPMTLPPGEYYVNVECESHVVWNDDSQFTAGWQVSFQQQDLRSIRSDKIWLSRQKGDQSFSVRIQVKSTTSVVFTLNYFTIWANTDGSMNLKRINIEPSARHRQPVTALQIMDTEEGAMIPENTTHCLVLPDYDFRDWYSAVEAYTQRFDRVIVVRSPAGNNLNRYRVVSAVAAPKVWFNDDPLGHIRRAYPNVVTVDVIQATTPAQLKTILTTRINNNQRYGTSGNQHTRFVLDWPTDSFTLQVNREFDVDMGSGKFHEGIDVDATRGVPVRASAAGTVFNVVTDANILGYGQYVQIQTRMNNSEEYLVTYTQLQNITVQTGQTVSVGTQLGECASDRGIKLVVQKAGLNTGTRYTMPGAVDPLPLLYVEGLTLHTSASSGLNIRKGQGTEYEKVGFMEATDTAKTLEKHGTTIQKLQEPSTENKWVNVDTSRGVTGYAAGWFLQARSPRSRVPNVALNGLNLDMLHPLGKPNPARLGAVSYVRMAYNVSMGRGSQDLNAAYNLYAPYLESMARANKKVILVYTHQTYGEGAGYVWERMDSARWQELAARYADFLKVIAKQYQGRGIIAAHQIWNEQDAEAGAQASVPIPPGDYANLLTKAIQAIRSVDPLTPIITGGHTRGPGKGVEYARQTLAAMPSNIRPDGIAAHPYGRGPDPKSKYAIFGHIEESIREYWNVMPGKRVWLTEWGVLNAPNEPASDISAYATSFVNYIAQNHPEKVAAAVWFAWADTMHNGYGLVNQSDQPKEPFHSNYIKIK